MSVIRKKLCSAPWVLREIIKGTLLVADPAAVATDLPFPSRAGPSPYSLKYVRLCGRAEPLITRCI
jgi:hypothetical protein